MNRRLHLASLGFASYFAFAALAAAQPTVPPRVEPGLPQARTAVVQAKELSPESARRLQQLADKVFRIKWSGKVYAASDRGFEVLTDTVSTLSNRPTGNAFFVQNLKASLSQPGFGGSDGEYIKRGRAILDGLGVDPSEIADIKLLQHFVQSGIVDPKTRVAKVGQVLKDRRSLLATRVVRGIPVWSSRLMLDLDREGRIVMLEMVWPKIDPKVMENAVALTKLAGSGFRPPEMKFAKPESVGAGILHSPAASFLDDQVAAIRVIYRPTDPTVGKKPVAYLDASGQSVAMPRQMIIREKAAAPRAGKAPVQPR